jgi:hypothetical protein
MRRLLVVTTVGLLLAAACSGDDDTGSPSATTGEGPGAGPTTTTVPSAPVVLSPEGNNLWAYEDTEGFPSQEVNTNAEEDPEGRDINGQICLFPGDSNMFVAGEDTGQPDPPAGWGVFELDGDRVGDFSITQVGKLSPTYQNHPDNFGCGFLSDGRLLTTDIGNTASGPPTGQLTVWFPPFEGDDVAYCKVDVAIATPGGLYVDAADDVFLGSARAPTAGVVRYSGDFPTGDDAEGGCGRTDGTGAPLVDEGAVDQEVFIAAGEHGLASPHSVAPAPDGGLYVSSVITGVINEYDADGAFVQTVLEPPAGEEIGTETYSTGTPLGIAVGPDGSLFYADIGIVADPEEGFGPGDRNGSVRVIRFEDGRPQPPEVVAEGLAFPDGLGVWATGDGADGGRSVL